MSLSEFKKYKDLLGFMENNSIYETANTIGAMGKYQFMSATLNNLESNIFN